MKSPMWIRFFIAFSILLSSCWEAKNDIPPASGNSGDIYLVMDSIQWKGLPGKVVDSLFRIDMLGLPRKEPIFRMRWIDPRKLNFILKKQRNLIFILTLDISSRRVNRLKNFFPKKSLRTLKANSQQRITTASDIYAKGQEVVYLCANTEKELIATLRNKGQHLIEHLNRKEKNRLYASLRKAGKAQGISKWLQKNFECDIHIPFDYKLVEREQDFLWTRQINPKDDQSIFIVRSNYTSKHQFEKEALIDFRNRICKKYLFEDPDIADSYVITETDIPFIPITTQTVQFKGQYAVKITGLWRSNNFSMGGPFVGYALVDESKGKFYYIEGFTFSPAKDQREIIRKLEAILGTFKVSVKIPQ